MLLRTTKYNLYFTVYYFTICKRTDFTQFIYIIQDLFLYLVDRKKLQLDALVLFYIKIHFQFHFIFTLIAV